MVMVMVGMCASVLFFVRMHPGHLTHACCVCVHFVPHHRVSYSSQHLCPSPFVFTSFSLSGFFFLLSFFLSLCRSSIRNPTRWMELPIPAPFQIESCLFVFCFLKFVLLQMQRHDTQPYSTARSIIQGARESLIILGRGAGTTGCPRPRRVCCCRQVRRRRHFQRLFPAKIKEQPIEVTRNTENGQTIPRRRLFFFGFFFFDLAGDSQAFKFCSSAGARGVVARRSWD
jgi:hypothetical protein